MLRRVSPSTKGEIEMKLKIVSIFDKAMNEFHRPAFVQSEGLAIRSFQDEVNRDDAQNDLFKHPADFELYLIGEFNTETGSLVSLERPGRMATAESLKR